MYKKIFITGGAGYVGAALVKKLLNNGYHVTVYDLMIYGKVLEDHENLTTIKADIRDEIKLKSSIQKQDIVIHLACISNDPSFELNPKLGKQINLDAFRPLVKLSKEAGVKKFIYASSSSVYGIKNEKNVHEDMKLEPLTDYSKFKVNCEKILFEFTDNNFITTIIRPATVCGYSPRQRFDLVVNILTNLAYHKREITVFGGNQLRPNIHIQDMIRAYETIINADNKKINGEIFNAGFDNQSINDLANTVKKEIGKDIKIIRSHVDDNRSYHISSDKIKRELNFKTKFTINDAIKDLKDAFDNKKLINTFEDINFFNIKKMQSIKLN